MSDQVKAAVSIGGVAFPKQPTDLDFEEYNLTKSGRVASGKMKMDIIAKKRKFNFAYSVISGSDCDVIMAVLNGWASFFELVYLDNGERKTATVYVGAIHRKKWRTDGQWYWKDFKFDLIEQ